VYAEFADLEDGPEHGIVSGCHLNVYRIATSILATDGPASLVVMAAGNLIIQFVSFPGCCYHPLTHTSLGNLI
jgi:hypothetical protein